MLTKENKFRIILDRDKHYDDIFFFAVKTTGIVCKPSCPAVRPLEKNVAFYDTVQAAIRQGFRPCKRCKPEELSDNNIMATIAALDVSTVKEAAVTLGISSRHLQRTTKQQLGISPHEISLAKRLASAMNLLAHTTLSIADVAFSSGFESLRQFNDAFKQGAHTTPRDYRNAHRAGLDEQATEPIEITLRLPFQKPLDWAPLKRALLAHMIPGLEKVDAERQTLERLIQTKNGHARITLNLQEPVDTIDIRVKVALLEDVSEVAKVIKRVFGLDSNPQLVKEAFMSDDFLKSLIVKHPGLRVCGMFDPFELLINTIIGQQISIPAARTFSARLVESYGQKIDGLCVFPTAAALAEANPAELYESTKLNHKKIATIQAVSQLIVNGFNLASITKSKTARQQLLAIKGIGPWTVEYVILRGFGDPDGFPAEDLFIKRALNAKNGREAELLAEKWRPYRGYATMHIWTKGTYE